MAQLTHSRDATVAAGRGAALAARLVVAAGRSSGPLDALGPMLAEVAGAFGAASAHVLRRGPGGPVVLAGQHGLDHLADRLGVPGVLPGEGQAGELLDGAPPRYVPSTARAAPWLDLWQRGPAGSALLVPLSVDDAPPWGCLVVEHVDAEAFSEADLVVLASIGEVVGGLLDALERTGAAREHAEREQLRRRVLAAGAAVVTAGLGAREVTEAAAAMLPVAVEELGWPAVGLLRRSPSGWDVVAVAGGVEVEPGDRLAAAGVLADPVEQHTVELDAATAPLLSAAGRAAVLAPLCSGGPARHLLVVEQGGGPNVPAAVLEGEVASVGARVALVLERLELLATEQQAQQRLAEVDRMRANLLAVAGHELRTPLTVVLGYADTLRERAGQLSPEQLTAAATKLGDRARHLSELVDRVLLAARLESDDVEVVPRAVRLEELVEEAGWTAGVELGSGLVDAVVRADPRWLDRALGLLVEQSRAAAREHVTLDARERDGRVAIIVRDDGHGIRGYERERVFRPFTHDGVAGQDTGLGPGVARGLVELMGGELRLYSAPGYGSTFLVLLPVA